MSSPVHRRTSFIHVVLLLPGKNFPSISPSIVARTTLSLLFQWQYLESFQCLICSKGPFSSGIPIFSRILVIVKRRPKKYSLNLSTECCQWWCIPNRRRQAVPRTCRSHWEGTIAECWTSALLMVPPAWLSQQNADDVECRHQMSGEGLQQGTSALFHEDSGMPERTAGMWLDPELATNGGHGGDDWKNGWLN